MDNWPSHVTKTRHLASRQNRPRLCLHFRITKRASDWLKRTHVGHFLRLRQAGPQNASNLSSNVNNATCLITVHTTRKHSPEFDKQVHQPRITGQLTRQTNKPTSEGKRETNKTHGQLQWRHLYLENLPLKNFSGGPNLYDELPSKNSKNVDFDCIMKAFFDERNEVAYKHLTFSTVWTVLHAIGNLLPTVAAKHFRDDLVDGRDGLLLRVEDTADVKQ